MYSFYFHTGKETALAVAKMGGIVHMVCRNEERGQQAADEVKKESGNLCAPCDRTCARCAR